MFGIPTDKVYLLFIGVVVLGVIGFLASSHIKNCVKDEVNNLQKIKPKKKRKIVRRQQQPPPEEFEREEPEDMASSVDPVKDNDNNIDGFNSDDFDGQAYNNNNVLMRDLISRPSAPNH